MYFSYIFSPFCVLESSLHIEISLFVTHFYLFPVNSLFFFGMELDFEKFVFIRANR